MQNIKVFHAAGIFKFLKWYLVFLALMFFSVPIIWITSALANGNYHNGLLASFAIYIIPIFIVIGLFDLFRYKVVITEKYIEANRLKQCFLNRDGADYVWALRRYKKGRIKIYFSDVDFAKVEQQFFAMGSGSHILTAIIFSNKNGGKQKIDIHISGKEKKEIITLLKQKLKVDDTPKDTSHKKFIEDIRTGKIK